MARWERACDALPENLARPVLDVGCAFGFGTAKIASRHRVVGVDSSADYIRRARRAYPSIPFVIASAAALPFARGAFGAVICLEVLEHVPDAERALAEIARVAALDAPVILSVPNEGALASCDSLNLYQRLRRKLWWLPAPPEIGEGWHRHYTRDALMALAHNQLRFEREWVTGLGFAEFIHLPLLVGLRGLLRWSRLFTLAQYIYFGAYILEDMLPVPRFGYHLMVRARRGA